MEQGTNKSLFTLITVVIFGIFLSLSYWLFQDQFKSVLGSVLEGTSELSSGFFNKTDGESDTQLGYYGDLSIVPNPASDFTFDPETGTILKYIGLSEKVVVPYAIDGVFVENIGAESFYNNINLTGVTFPNTIKSIGNDAFYGTRLVTLTLPNSVETLGSYSFYNIPTLTTVTTGTGLKKINTCTFANTGLNKITLNEGLLEIGKQSFQSTKLELLTIPSTVKTLGTYIAKGTTTLKTIIIPTSLKSQVFDSYTKTTFDNPAERRYYDDLLVTTSGDFIVTTKGVLVKYLGSDSELTIPNTIGGVILTSIGEYAFYNNINLTGVTFPNTIKSIGNDAFYGTRLVTLTLPNSVETLGSYSFYNIPTLTTVTTGTGLKTINTCTFANTGLNKITLNEGLLEIGKQSFQKTNLELLTIPSTVTTLGTYIAKDTTTLKTIIIPTSLKSQVFDSYTKTTFDNIAERRFYDDLLVTTSGDFIVTTKGVLVKYLGSDSELTIPNNIGGVTLTSIGEYAFYNNINLTGVTLPNTITSIGNDAFYGTRLATLTLPNSVETLGSYSFSNIPTLTTVTTGTGLKEINTCTFANTGLNKITLNEGLLEIGKQSFQSTKLEVLTIPSTVTTLGTYIAKDTTTLKTINIPTSLKSQVFDSYTKTTFDNSATRVYY